MRREPIYGLVRDKDGKPKFDNPKDIPLALWALLSEKERTEVRARGGHPQGDKT